MERTGSSRESSTAARSTHHRAAEVLVRWALALGLLCAFVVLAGRVMGDQAFSFDLPVMQAVRRLESSPAG